MEEIVAQRVARRLGGERQARGVVEAHHLALGVAHERELVHPPAIDLHLLLVEAMHQVRDFLVGGDVLLDRERRVGERRRKRRARVHR